MKFDFSGWATKSNLKCSDGRTIMPNAFKHNDGNKVPLVWNHRHDSPSDVLGHAILQNRREGVYAYCRFNDTESGRQAKEMVKHGDINALSIYANNLKQDMGNVIHGNIREVSLVLAGANPGAFIDNVMAHGEELDDRAVIYTGEEIELEHSDEFYEEEMYHADDEETIEDIFNTLTPKQKDAVYFLIGQAIEGGDSVQHSDDDADYDDEDYDEEYDDEDETIADIVNTMDEKQQDVMNFLIEQALENGGNNSMKHNVFENEEYAGDVLTHSEMTAIMDDAKRYGSLKDVTLQHAAEYGIENIDYLFPEAKDVTNMPTFIKRETGWVDKVMNAVHNIPFSRIKSTFANITEDEARARGYIKGNLKKEEVFSLLKRTTSPTTIYKKQKLDRDDVVDITFDIIPWLKSEMRLMLNEEIARAILIGDGRLASSEDKIQELNIRPVYNDDELFTIQYGVKVAKGATEADKAKEFIRSLVRSRKQYRGSGMPTLFTTEDMLTECLLLEDKNGRIIYDSVDKLATAMRVKEIVTVPVMDKQKSKNNKPLIGIVVNLADYYVGADRGGQVSMFDDFDIDFNQQKYLIETRCSGALTVPFSAIALELDEATA